MIILSEQKCVACEGGVAPFTYTEAENHLKEIKDWKLGKNLIEKNFKFKDFKEAMTFVNSVSEIAEKEAHHPDIHISYNKVHLVLTTHAIKGLSLNDFIVAAKINKI